MPTANPEELTRFNKIIQLVIAMFSDLLAVLKKGKNMILKVVKFTICFVQLGHADQRSPGAVEGPTGNAEDQGGNP